MELSKSDGWHKHIQFEQNGNAWAITTFSIKLYDARTSALELEVTHESSGVVMDGAGGIIDVQILASVINAIAWHRGYHSILVNGEEILNGPVKIIS